MGKLQERLARLYDLKPGLAGSLLGLVALGALLLLHSLLGYVPSLRALYVLPIWLATRLGGRAAGLLMVFATTIATQWTELPQTGGSATALLSSTLIRFGAYGAVMLLIAEVEEALQRHQKMALHDPLTGLLNRRALEQFGNHAFTRAKQQSHPLTVVMIDCDGFKQLNDTHGHHTGDVVLQMLARTLEINTRTTDLIARVGGDEFVVVLQDTIEAEAKQVMARVEQAFETAVKDAGYASSLSTGYAPLSEASSTFDDLVSVADMAMYERKRAKKAGAYLN